MQNKCLSVSCLSFESICFDGANCFIFQSDIHSTSFACHTYSLGIWNVGKKKQFSDKMFKMWFMIINQTWNVLRKIWAEPKTMTPNAMIILFIVSTAEVNIPDSITGNRTSNHFRNVSNPQNIWTEFDRYLHIQIKEKY